MSKNRKKAEQISKLSGKIYGILLSHSYLIKIKLKVSGTELETRSATVAVCFILSLRNHILPSGFANVNPDALSFSNEYILAACMADKSISKLISIEIFKLEKIET